LVPILYEGSTHYIRDTQKKSPTLHRDEIISFFSHFALPIVLQQPDIVTGGAPGYFIRHFSIAALLRVAESLRASGREWRENATYNEGFFDKAMALCESMSKPVIAAISGTVRICIHEFTYLQTPAHNTVLFLF
jgi:hypothetical protein